MKLAASSATRTLAASLALVSVATAGTIVLSRGGGNTPPAVAAAVHHSATRPLSAATRPADSSSTSNTPSTPTLSFNLPRPGPVAREYEGLLKRSLFSARPPRNIDPDEAEKASHSTPRRAEADLVLRGVSLQEDRYTALVEDTGSQKVRLLHEGDSIGRGRVSKVSFSGIEYESAGDVTPVAIGQDLTGRLQQVASDDSPRRAKPDGPGGSGNRKKGKSPMATTSINSDSGDEADPPKNPKGDKPDKPDKIDKTQKAIEKIIKDKGDGAKDKGDGGQDKIDKREKALRLKAEAAAE